MDPGSIPGTSTTAAFLALRPLGRGEGGREIVLGGGAGAPRFAADYCLSLRRRRRVVEAVGANKSLPTTRGVVAFAYKPGRTESPGNFVYFAIVPMAENGIGRKGLIELGGDRQGDPRNPRSPFRQRYFVPRQHYGDDQWHVHELRFDFTNMDGAFHVIFAARVNEGIEKPGEIDVCVRGVRAWSS